MVRLANLLMLAALLIGVASSADAQTRVRVNSDRTTIWQPGFQIVADIVDEGTVLTVISRSGNFYEVELPRPIGSVRRGFVAVSRVVAMDNEPLRVPERTAAPGNNSARNNPPTEYLFRVFGQGGYGRFTADQTFKTVMGTATATWFGGGIQIRTASGPFFEIAVDRYQDTGNRVFVYEGEVFDLGSDTTVRIIPVTASFGYRFWQKARTAAYVSGGIGGVIYRETTAGNTEDENINDRFATYQGVVGFEFPLARRLASAVEFQYSTVPGAFNAGVASLYDEDNLGVMQVRVKVLFGR